jgi:phosphoglycerol transferase MdoB-like AlkP superfamily enzyme
MHVFTVSLFFKPQFPDMVSRLIKWLLTIGVLLLLLMTILRFVFYFDFKTQEYTLHNSFNAFVLGLRYDLRMICGLLLPVLIISGLHIKRNEKGKLDLASILRLIVAVLLMTLLFLFYKNNKAPIGLYITSIALFALVMTWLFLQKSCNPYHNNFSKRVWKWYLVILISLMVLFYAVDLQHYDYLHTRLNASVLNYLEDLNISMGMMWESYPILRIILGIVVVILFIYWFIGRSYKRIENAKEERSIVHGLIGGFIFLLLGLGVFGRIGQFPLRWSDAFSFGDEFKANLSLNPIQSFFSTLRYRNSGYDVKKVKQYYLLMSKYLEVQNPNIDNLNYERIYSGVNTKKPNIVLVICESFSGYKSSMWGNPLNTTPYFNQMCNTGVFFDNCFTPAYGTARGVWATITGIPDVESPSTASRNPVAVDQHTIISDFDGYQKYYFLGGSTSWANIRGLLTNNIPDLHLYEEGKYKSKAVDVWGISDKHLFLEANGVLKEEHEPFFAVIQTADNHRPYTIPDEDMKEFKLMNYPDDTLHKYGFDNNKELNAFRYTDFSYQQFMEAAKKESYFSNTIFIFVGDHGIVGNADNLFPKSWSALGLTYHHVPLLFYSPSVLQPKRIKNACSQVDILPSVASLVNISYTNATMGRNLFDTVTNSSLRFNDRAFLYDPESNDIGIVTNDYCYIKNIRSGKEGFMSTRNNNPLPNDSLTINNRKALNELTWAYYETAKYMLLHNKKKEIKK